MRPSISFDSFKSFIDNQLKPQARMPNAPPKPFVTLSRQAGAGGSSVATKLIEYLEKRTGKESWTLYDKTLGEKVAEDLALPKQIASYLTESKTSFIESTIEELLGLHPSIETMVQQSTRTILSLAELGHVVLVGRGANIITAKLPQGFHVRLVGSIDKRIEHHAEWMNFSRQKAAHTVKVIDSGRKVFLKKYYGADIDDATRYHLVINTDHVTFEEAATLIGEAVLRREPRAPKPRLSYLEPVSK